MRFPPDAQAVAELLCGEWTRRPGDDWVLSRIDSTRRIARRGEAEPGTLAHTLVHTSSLKKLERALGSEGDSAILTERDRDLGETELPILRVADVGEALETLTNLARDHVESTIIAVTGSVGKTTTRSMIRQILAPHLSVYEGRGNEPVPIRRQIYDLGGQEQDVGLFEVSRLCLPGTEQLLGPHIAVVTGIAEAHLEALGTLEEVARTKSLLFEGLAEGGTAIINIDSPHSDILVEKAHQHAGHVLTYGASEGADLRLRAYDPARSEVTIEHEGTELTYTLGASGRHNALNSLAVLGVLQALGRDPRDHLESFGTIEPVEGRGDVRELSLGSHAVTVVDQSYNANPTSMAAALEGFHRQFPDSRRVLVLGDMLELGPAAEDLHRGMLEAVLSAEPAAVILVGPQMGGLWAELPDEVRVMHCLNAQPVLTAVPEQIQDGDALLVKASRGVGLVGVVEAWKSAPQPPTGAWRIVISGTVQRVGYRRWVQERAQEHGVSGWIRNRSDGKVEARAQGSADQFGTFLGELHSGPAKAQVTNVSTRTVETSEATGFRIRRSRNLEQPPTESDQPSRAGRLAGKLLAPVRGEGRRRS